MSRDFGTHTHGEDGIIIPTPLGGGNDNSSDLTTEQEDVLKHFRYDEPSRKLIANRAIETTLNSLYLGEQHKMSSGAENIFFTNLGNDTNFYPMWGGLKDQSLTSNQGADGFIPPSGRVYSDLFNLPLGGNPNPATATGYSGGNFFGVNIAGLGITTTAAEQIDADVRLEYRLSVNGRQVYMQVLPRNAPRSSANETIFPSDLIEWWFDHPVEIHAGTTIFAEIVKVRESDDEDLGVFQVRQGDTVDPNTGELRYQAIVHNRLFEDKDLELISPYLKYQAMDFGLDATGATILLRDLSLGTDSLLVPHAVNTLQAVANGTTIQIKVKDGQKIIVESLPVNAVSINGSFVNSVLNLAVGQLNDIFTNSVGFTSADTFVNSFNLTGNSLTLGLNDGTSFTVDVTTLGVDENNFVTSGELIGSNLVLTMGDGSTVTIDASNMVNGSSGLATSSGWFISYGTNANNAVGTSTNDSSVHQQLPFYFGEALEQGSEFKWNFQSHGGSNLVIGIWDGAETPVAYNGGASTASNWGTAFSYAGGFINGSNSTLTTTNSGSKYVVANGDALGIRFDSSGFLTLIDYSGGGEVEIAKTDIALAVTSFNLQMYTWANGVLPNGIISNNDFLWDIKHDYAGTESGVMNGVLTHTILERTLSLSVGEQYMIPLDKQGAGETFGLDYLAAATGVITAEDNLVTSFKYQTNESIIADSNWSHNTTASGFFLAGGGTIDSYRVGGAGTEIGLLSLRYMPNNTLELWSETNDELIATTVVHPDGSDINLHYGVNGNTNFVNLPIITKQVIGQGTQPNVDFVPTVADQTVTVTEAEVLNLQIITSDNIVNQFAESDAPSWMSLDQTSGVLSGTAPAFAGTSADTIVVNCKAGNAIGGTVDFTVTVTIAEAASSYTNANSLSFNGTSSYLQGNPVLMNALDRATNGDGNAWTIGMWVKPSTATSTQTLLVYGAGDDYNGGAITLKIINGVSLVLNYGTVYNSIITVAGNALTANTWQHIMVTFDGGTTGSASSDINDYYSRFSVAVDGVVVSTIGANANYGYTGAISGANTSDNIFRIGRANNIHNNYTDSIINQVAIWSTDESANLATIYNSGATQDLSLLASAPDHYYEIESSVTAISDVSGSVDLVGHNFSSSDLVTDTP